jgi:hypothetical protein
MIMFAVAVIVRVSMAMMAIVLVSVVVIRVGWGGSDSFRLGLESSERREKTVAFDPYVWTRRALQEKTLRLGCTVLHQCIRPHVGAHAPDHHGIRARPT